MENAARIARYLAGLDQQSFARNDWARDAVERCVERVCEATVRLGEQADELMPGQPWSDIRGMGNRLRHAYDRWTLISFGGQPRTACPIWQPQRNGRWRNSNGIGLTG